MKCKIGENMILRKREICESLTLLLCAFGQDHAKSAEIGEECKIHDCKI
jgi:hypothetical protein